ncbi:MAG: metallophosphoesterase [Planctomycetota bacterium]
MTRAGRLPATLLALAALMALRPAGPMVHAEDAPGGAPRGGRGGRGGEGGKGGPPGVFRTDVPDHEVDAVLGRPTRTSVVVSVRATAALEVCVAWGPAGRDGTRRTDVHALRPDEPVLVPLPGLEPDTAYVARVLRRASPPSPWAEGEALAFRTQRPAGSSFTFTVVADSHLDQATDLTVLDGTLANVAADVPDFHVDLGDTFMTDKYRDDFKAALPQYRAQRWWLSRVRAPVFLALGNHDGETGWRDRGTADDMPHWSLAQRKRYFPNPEPDDFYAGNDTPDPVGGRLQNWYGWTWGDAQFLVLDPYWSTRNRKGRDGDGWTWTLGEAQYRWLEKTLATRPARYRFVFLHHLVGGLGFEARGGLEAARLYEWGGRSFEGAEQFAAKRPGWSAPVHDLLRRAGATVVFHGHDHFYARQELDGVVYQLVPQPGHPGGDAAKMAAAYGYVAGEFLPSPGHVRVRVTPQTATVEYVRGGPRGPAAAATVVKAYTVPAAGAAPVTPSK